MPVGTGSATQERGPTLSIRDQIPVLEQLSAIDQDIRRIDEQADKEKGSLDGLRGRLADTERRLAQDRASLVDLERLRGELQTEVRQMTQQIERSREKLARSRNERESVASQREMEELRKLVRDREDEIARLTASADGARGSIADTESVAKSLGGTVDGDLPSTEKLLAELATQRAEKVIEREALVKQLPSLLYRRYEQIRTKRPVAIARTSTGTCQGCFLEVPPMQFQKLRVQEAFDQCPHCKRILYYVPPEPAPEPPPAPEPAPKSKRSKAAGPQVA